MADTKVSSLTAASALAGTELFYADDGVNDVKVTATQIKTWASLAPTILGGTATALTGLGIRDTSAAFDVTIAAVSSATLTAGRTLTLDMGNVAHTLALGTTANTITFPNAASGTVPLLNLAQSFTATQTFAAILTTAITQSASNASAASTRISNTNTSSSGFVDIFNFNNAGAYFGFQVGGSAATGNYNSTGIANASIAKLTTSGSNMIIGFDSGTTGPILFVSNGAEVGRWISGGGFSSAGAMTATLANTATTSAVCYNTGTGLLTYDGTIGTCTVSAARYKEGFQSIADADALGMVMAMQPKSWNYKWEPGRNRIGLVADDLLAIDPRLVGFGEDGEVANDNYWAVITLVAGAVKKQQAEIGDLRARIAA